MEKIESKKQDLEAMIPAVILPDGYRGKILLVLITRGNSSMVVLRSGDLWHREILRNTQAEMIRIGLPDVRVEEIGVTCASREMDRYGYGEAAMSSGPVIWTTRQRS